MVGLETSDDAAVYKLSDEHALILTVDFFTPVVDDPYLFGQVAAANALSDVYAMGGQPLLALNIAGFPNCLSPDILTEILRGGADKVMEAGAILAGGHTVQDDEPKYGLAVAGLVHPDRVISNAGAQPGDVIVLTKPLGTGIINTAVKGELVSREVLAIAIKTMATLNKEAARVMSEVGANACTDITGFGLLGHTAEMAGASNTTIVINCESIPVLPGVRELAGMGMIPAGTYSNRDYLKDKTAYSPHVSPEEQAILLDPQTSGGLLIALPEGKKDELLSGLNLAGIRGKVVGTVVERQYKDIIIEP